MSMCIKRSTETAELELRSSMLPGLVTWESGSFICKKKQKNFYLMRFLRSWEKIIAMISSWAPSIMLHNQAS